MKIGVLAAVVAVLTVVSGCNALSNGPAAPNVPSCGVAFGYDTNNEDNWWDPGYMTANAFDVASETMVTCIKVKVEGDTPFAAAIYKDNGGKPGTLVGETGHINAVAGWNEASIPPATIEPGKYWIVTTGSLYGVSCATTDVMSIYAEYNWTGEALPTDAGALAWEEYAGSENKAFAIKCE